MKFIELHIECHSGENKLAELGLKSDAPTEWRLCIIPLDAIMMIYPAREGGTMIFIGAEDFLVSESYTEVKALILKI